MMIDTRHLYINTGGSIFELPASVYINFLKLPPNLRYHWRGNSSIHIEIGFFGKSLQIEIMWNFIERERTEREEKLYQDTLELIEELNNEISI